MSESENSPVWFKSSLSGPGQCVEVRHTSDAIQVRDSKSPQGPVLTFTHAEWDAFLGGIRLGEFDLSDH